MLRVIGILILVGIISVSCSTTEDLSLRPLYSIDKYDYHDAIDGTLFKSQLLIAKELGPLHSSVVTLEKYASGRQAMYSIDVQFAGPDWRNMDEITLRIDGEIITLTADEPIRIRKSSDTVTESITCFLDEPAFKGLRYCRSLEIQFHDEPIVIPQEGLEAIWRFLKD